MKFADRFKAWWDESLIVHEGLAYEGEQLCSKLFGSTGSPLSLRETARRSGLSPTYLSHIANRKSIISAGAYLRLHKVFEGLQ